MYSIRARIALDKLPSGPEVHGPAGLPEPDTGDGPLRGDSSEAALWIAGDLELGTWGGAIVNPRP